MFIEYLKIKMRKFELTVIFLSIISTTTAIETVYMDTNCGTVKTISDSTALKVKLTRWSTYKAYMHCQLTIDSGYASTDQLMIQFNDLSIEYAAACTSDSLTIYDGDSKQDGVIGKRFCGYSTPSGVYTSSGHVVTLYFKSDDSVQDSGFDITITPYHTGYCYSWEYDCANGRCIDNSLKCNGHNPCGDNSDCSVSVGTITGISVGSTTAVIVAVIVVVCVVRRRRMVLVRAPVARATTVTTIGTTTVQQHPPPYAQFAPVGYSQPPPQQYSPVAPQNVAYPPQPMTSYPPPAYPGQAPKY